METLKFCVCVQVLIYDPLMLSAFRDQHLSEIFVGHLVTTVTCVWCSASCSKYHGLPFGVVIDVLEPIRYRKYSTVQTDSQVTLRRIHEVLGLCFPTL